MDETRLRRLAALRQQFTVTEVGGRLPPDDVVAETVARYLNRKHGRPVVVRRAQRGDRI